MKEYKVIKRPTKLLGNNQALEDTLNSYAREGWVLKELIPESRSIILERDKNR